MRFVADHWVKEADEFFNGTSAAKDALLTQNLTEFDNLVKQMLHVTMSDVADKAYFMNACKYINL